MDSGLPSWEALVLAMYYKVMDKQRLGYWRPFPNYLFAIAEWQLKNLKEPLDISARKIRIHFKNKQNEFFELLRETLYSGFRDQGQNRYKLPAPKDIQTGNPTMRGVVELCSASLNNGVKNVITYNYDSILEHALDTTAYRAIWKAGRYLSGNYLPIYHVHGYVPFDGKTGSSPNQIVFTEDQYNKVASDPYSWSNLIQIHCLSSTVGLMIGLSLSDRNMRRLLDAVRKTPIKTTNYALLKKPKWDPPSPEELMRIHSNAQDYFEKFEKSGIKRARVKKGPNWQDEISGILQEVQEKSNDQQKMILDELGILPIWFDDYSEIPDILKKIVS
jgi:hypothetical protein